MSRCSVPMYLSLLLAAMPLPAQVSAQSSSSSSSRLQSTHSHRPPPAKDALDSGIVSNSVYRNSSLGLSCKIPDGWVQRTEEMNSHDGNDTATGAAHDTESKESPSNSGRVLLAAFSRPPQARAENVNSSILIAAESAASYPGLKDAAQYFGPLTEVTKARGFTEVGEPYEFAMGTKILARDDFQKDVGTRVMRQATLVMLARGYVVSFTFIGGTEDEVEELVGGLSFASSAKPGK